MDWKKRQPFFILIITGSVNATANIENIIEHIADHLNKDPLEIRELNFTTGTKKNQGGIGPQTENKAATSIVPMLKEQAMYKARRAEIEQFNKVASLCMTTIGQSLKIDPPKNYDCPLDYNGYFVT